jgi:hypothetical protein
MAAKCGCKLGNQEGGSLASTNVVEFVPCEAWNSMEAANVFGGGSSDMGNFRVVMDGGKKKKSRKPKSSEWRPIQSPRPKRPSGGAVACGNPVPSTVPSPTWGASPSLSLPAHQTSTVFDYSTVGQSVLGTLQSQAVTSSLLPAHVYIPKGVADMGTQLYP